MLDEIIVGLIGLGYDEDGTSGFINPLMIDEKYQGNHYSEQAMAIAIEIIGEDKQDYFQSNPIVHLIIW